MTSYVYHEVRDIWINYIHEEGVYENNKCINVNKILRKLSGKIKVCVFLRNACVGRISRDISIPLAFQLYLVSHSDKVVYYDQNYESDSTNDSY